MRRTTGSIPRRGAALLLVLAALIIVMTAVAGAARVVSAHRLAAQSHDAASILDEVLPALEAPIQHWLEERASSVVLPSDAVYPSAMVLDDTIPAGESILHVRISAWDQCGMVPIDVARKGSPLRIALPSPIRSAIDEFIDDDRPGLDQFVMLTANFDQVLAFPHTQSSRTAIGAHIATHNTAPPKININTAPMPLLEQAIRVAGRGDLEVIRSLRDQGKQSSATVRAHSQNGDAGIQLVSRSTVWSFRLDLSLDDFTRSWWSTYQYVRLEGQRAPQWICVQRLTITEVVQ